MAGNQEQLPREFGKYHLIERIATGGMAELYRAKLYGAGGFEKDLAIKKVLPHLAGERDFIQMFMDEAMITVTLNHGNIVSVLDFGEIEGAHFLVMEFIDGVDLQSLIRRSTELFEPFPPAIACHIAHEICRGLDYAHRKVGPDGKPLKIVHRDVSPQNILITFEGEVKIVDFGIARAASRLTSTQHGVLKGKVAYMSPEQIMGSEVDNRSDIFATAIILYEMLTNHRPFEGATPQETMALITRGVFEKPQRLNSKIPKRLAEILKKGLEKNPRKRYATAGEMAADLSDVLHREGLRPDPSTVAAFIIQRLPEAKPRTMPPTPIRAIRRDAARAAHLTPASQQPVAAQKPERSSAFPPAAAPAPAPAAVEPAADSPEAVAVVGEAVSFDVLNLPGYSEAADSRRPTDPMGSAVQVPTPSATPAKTLPEMPAASPPDPGAAPVAAPPPDLLSAPTRLFNAPSPTEPPAQGQVLGKVPDAQLLSAKTMLLSKPDEPAPASAAKAAASAQPSPTVMVEGMPAAAGSADANLEERWLQKAPPPKGTSFEDEEPQIMIRPKQSRGKLLAVIGVGLAVVLVGSYFILKSGGSADTSGAVAPPTPIPPPRPAEVDAGAPAAVPANPPEPAPDAAASSSEEPAGANVAAAENPAAPDAGETDAGGKTSVAAGPPDAGPPAGADEPPKMAKVQPPVDTPKPPAPKPPPPKPPTPKPPPPDKVAVAPKPPPAGGATGTLRINSEPFAVVYLGAQKIGPTPQMDVKLPVGSHTLTLKNDALGITKKVRVVIEKDKVHTVFVDLNQK